MIDLGDRFEHVRSGIADAEARFGRQPGSVVLLAVSKFHSADAITAAMSAGQLQFAENYLQELQSKATELAKRFPAQSLEWHFTGRIQSKKARAIAALCDWVHSVDRIEVARKLNQYRTAKAPPLNVCVQVNLDKESDKSGVMPDQLCPLIDQISSLPKLSLRGLMAIPQPQQGFDRQRKSFARLRNLFDILQQSDPSWDTLSMGMSADFAAAIAEGATIVRVGTALFGPRRR